MKRIWEFIFNASQSRTTALLVILVIGAAIPLTVLVAQKQQNIQQKADTACSAYSNSPSDCNGTTGCMFYSEDGVTGVCGAAPGAATCNPANCGSCSSSPTQCAGVSGCTWYSSDGVDGLCGPIGSSAGVGRLCQDNISGGAADYYCDSGDYCNPSTFRCEKDTRGGGVGGTTAPPTSSTSCTTPGTISCQGAGGGNICVCTSSGLDCRPCEIGVCTLVDGSPTCQPSSGSAPTNTNGCSNFGNDPCSAALAGQKTCGTNGPKQCAASGPSYCWVSLGACTAGTTCSNGTCGTPAVALPPPAAGCFATQACENGNTGYVLIVQPPNIPPANWPAATHTVCPTGTRCTQVAPSGNFCFKADCVAFTPTEVPTAAPTVTTLAFKLADINRDRTVDILDYNTLISCSVFGKDNKLVCGSFAQNADLNKDGAVDQIDYNTFLREYSK